MQEVCSNMLNWTESSFCARGECTRPTWAGSRYCRFCQRKGLEEEQVRQRTLHQEALSQRTTAPQAWRVLHSFCTGEVVTYAVAVPGAVKFGSTPGLGSHLEKLQAGNPRRLRLLAKIPASQSLPVHLRKALKDHAIRGDWFRLDPITRAVVRLMRAGDLEALCQWLSGHLSRSANSRLVHSASRLAAAYEERESL